MKRRNMLIVTLIISLSVGMIPLNVSYGASKLDAARDSLAAAQQKIKSIKQQLTSGQKKEKDLVNQIQDMDLKIESAQNDIDALSVGINEKKGEISTAQVKLDQIQAELDKQNDSLDKRLRTMYKSGDTSMLQILLGSSDFTEFMTNLDMVQLIYQNDVDVLKEIQQRFDVVDAQKQKLVKLKGELEEQQNQQKDKQQQLQDSKNEAAQLREMVASNNDELSEQIDRLNQEANDLTSTIKSLESTGTTYTGGQMAWPVPGCYKITSPFGYRMHPILRVKKLHTGMDISCPTGTTVVAANDGKVIVSKYYGGYGNCVMIDHGGSIVTLYGHNSKLLVSVGDTVKRGQAIAYSGSTGQSTGPHCHFEVRVNGSYVDPSPYLK